MPHSLSDPGQGLKLTPGSESTESQPLGCQGSPQGSCSLSLKKPFQHLYLSLRLQGKRTWSNDLSKVSRMRCRLAEVSHEYFSQLGTTRQDGKERRDVAGIWDPGWGGKPGHRWRSGSSHFVNHIIFQILDVHSSKMVSRKFQSWFSKMKIQKLGPLCIQLYTVDRLPIAFIKKSIYLAAYEFIIIFYFVASTSLQLGTKTLQREPEDMLWTLLPASYQLPWEVTASSEPRLWWSHTPGTWRLSHTAR